MGSLRIQPMYSVSVSLAYTLNLSIPLQSVCQPGIHSGVSGSSRQRGRHSDRQQAELASAVPGAEQYGGKKEGEGCPLSERFYLQGQE